MIGVKKFYIVFAMTLFMFFLVEIQGRSIDGLCESNNDCIQSVCCFSIGSNIRSSIGSPFGSDIGYCSSKCMNAYRPFGPFAHQRNNCYSNNDCLGIERCCFSPEKDVGVCKHFTWFCPGIWINAR